MHMKKQIFFLMLIALMPALTYSQCTPDTVNCKDVLTPGQICPEVLMNGYLGVPYSQTMTILPPTSATINDVTITLVKIKIDTVSNLPPGIGYTINAEEMYPGTAYCVLIDGTPTLEGIYMLHIRVIPYINLLGDIVELPPVENDTSVRIAIYDAGAIISPNGDAFHVIENRPNPFSGTTAIGFIMDESAEVTLQIHDDLGVLVYWETMQAKPGRNFFRFTGENICPGHYIYSIVSKQDVYAGKMIKTGK
jgi:hypothetical protein